MIAHELLPSQALWQAPQAGSHRPAGTARKAAWPRGSRFFRCQIVWHIQYKLMFTAFVKRTSSAASGTTSRELSVPD